MPSLTVCRLLPPRYAAVVAASLAALLLVLPGCGGAKSVPGGPTPEPSLVLTLEAGDARRGEGEELPGWVQRRWSGEHLLTEGGASAPAQGLRLRVTDGTTTLREGRIRLPADALQRPSSDAGPLPVARLRRPAATFSLVGRSGGGDEGEAVGGVVQTRIDAGFLAALERLDPAATLDQALWLALLGLDADGLDTYRKRAAPADAAEAITLREAGVSPAEADRLRRAGVEPEVEAMRAAAGTAEGTAGGIAPARTVAEPPRRRLPPARPDAGPPARPVVASRLQPTPAPATEAAADRPDRTTEPAAPAPPAPAREPEAAAAVDPALVVLAMPAPAATRQEAPAAAVESVPARYAELMGRLGYTRSNELAELFAARVEPRSVRDFVDAGHNPTAEELLAARAAGVDGADALALARAGYRFRLAEILGLAEAGVDTEYAVALVDPRYPTLTAEQLKDLKARGVTAEEVREIRNR